VEDIIHNSMTNFGTGHIFDGIPDKSLPDKLIPLNLQKLIYAYQHKTASPTPTIFLALMTVLSAVYSSNIDVEGLSGRRIPLNFYGLIMSGTGDGKSSAVSAVLAPVLEFEKKINESYVRNMIDFKAEKIIFNKQQKVLEKRLEKAIENESKGRILLNEKIHEHLQECPKGKRSANPPLRIGANQANADFFQFHGKSSWSFLLGQVGSFSRTSQR